jgi:glycerol-1-phosphate dehydrogenase [NAD(P)+]
VTGEYYCARIAGLMRGSLEKIVSAAPRLMERDPAVIQAVAEGLILSGIAMSFAKVSRPASGLEHYFSHLWEMFALDRGLPLELHGIQVGVGTTICLNIYDRLCTVTPNRATAEQAMREFDSTAWEAEVRRIFGGAAQTLIDSEKTIWHKNDPARHQQRLEKILEHWPEIQEIMREEIPPKDMILPLMKSVGMPVRPEDIGETAKDTKDAFIASRDIRDKYLTSSLLWDLGLLYTFPIEEC